MTKLIILVAAVVVIVWLLRRAMAGTRAGKPPEPGPLQGELVECAQCSIKLPRAEARSAGGRVYCSDEHLRLGPRDG